MNREDTKGEHSNIPIQKYFEKICDERSHKVSVRIKGIEDFYNQKFESQQEALKLANKTLELRLEKLNELRNEVLQDRARYVTSDNYESYKKAFDDRIKQLELWQSKIFGISIASSLIGGLIGALMIILIQFIITR